MNRVALHLTAIFSLLGFATAETTLTISGRAGKSEPVTLIGPDARQQLLVTAATPNEHDRDVTGEVAFSIQPEGIAEFTDAGFLHPVGNGKATITAELSGAKPATIEVNVQQATTPLPINFTNEIVPILTRHGCNGGGCHGKSGGQNGFRLSLLGYEPWNDYDYLMREGRVTGCFPPTKSTDEPIVRPAR